MGQASLRRRTTRSRCRSNPRPSAPRPAESRPAGGGRSRSACAVNGRLRQAGEGAVRRACSARRNETPGGILPLRVCTVLPRVSKADGSQSLDLQRVALQAAGVRADRPGLDSCVRVFRAGDVLVVWKLDRSRGKGDKDDGKGKADGVRDGPRSARKSPGLRTQSAAAIVNCCARWADSRRPQIDSSSCGTSPTARPPQRRRAGLSTASQFGLPFG